MPLSTVGKYRVSLLLRDGNRLIVSVNNGQIMGGTVNFHNGQTQKVSGAYAVKLLGNVLNSNFQLDFHKANPTIPGDLSRHTPNQITASSVETVMDDYYGGTRSNTFESVSPQSVASMLGSFLTLNVNLRQIPTSRVATNADSSPTTHYTPEVKIDPVYSGSPTTTNSTTDTQALQDPYKNTNAGRKILELGGLLGASAQAPNLNQFTGKNVAAYQRQALSLHHALLNRLPLPTVEVAKGVFSTHLPKPQVSMGGGLPIMPPITINDEASRRLMKFGSQSYEAWLAQAQRCKNLEGIILQILKHLEDNPTSVEMQNNLKYAQTQKNGCEKRMAHYAQRFWQYHDALQVKTKNTIDVHAMNWLDYHASDRVPHPPRS